MEIYNRVLDILFQDQMLQKQVVSALQQQPKSFEHFQNIDTQATAESPMLGLLKASESPQPSIILKQNERKSRPQDKNEV